jgi:MoxR-like ATPase
MKSIRIELLEKFIESKVLFYATQQFRLDLKKDYPEEWNTLFQSNSPDALFRGLINGNGENNSVFFETNKIGHIYNENGQRGRQHIYYAKNYWPKLIPFKKLSDLVYQIRKEIDPSKHNFNQCIFNIIGIDYNHATDDQNKLIEDIQNCLSEEANMTNKLDESLVPSVNPKKRLSKLYHTLRLSKNIVLEGVPGTGKTFAIKNDLCKSWPNRASLKGKGTGAYAITLHPATTYEDFVEGLRPVVTNRTYTETTNSTKSPTGNTYKKTSEEGLKRQNYFHNVDKSATEAESGDFTIQDGFFLRVCAEAVNNPKSDYLVLLDEINRCNVPKVMGDLLTTIERSKRATWDIENHVWDLSKCQVVTLPSSKRLFFVPENIYIVATMNTTDRSVAPLDSALRRRFAFIRLWPKGFDTHTHQSDEVIKAWENEFRDDHKTPVGKLLNEKNKAFNQSLNAWVHLNEGLHEKGPDAMLGHSYLFDLAEDIHTLPQDVDEKELVIHHWTYHILPQLIDIAITNHFETDLVRAKQLGELTNKLFINSLFILKGQMPQNSSLLTVPSLVLASIKSIKHEEVPATVMIQEDLEESGVVTWSTAIASNLQTNAVRYNVWNNLDDYRVVYLPRFEFNLPIIESVKSEYNINLRSLESVIMLTDSSKMQTWKNNYQTRPKIYKQLIQRLDKNYKGSINIDKDNQVDFNSEGGKVGADNSRFAIILNDPLSNKKEFESLLSDEK